VCVNTCGTGRRKGERVERVSTSSIHAGRYTQLRVAREQTHRDEHIPSRSCITHCRRHSEKTSRKTSAEEGVLCSTAPSSSSLSHPSGSRYASMTVRAVFSPTDEGGVLHQDEKGEDDQTNTRRASWRVGEVENWRVGEVENWRVGELERERESCWPMHTRAYSTTLHAQPYRGR
jgi:hypothetical protein